MEAIGSPRRRCRRGGPNRSAECPVERVADPSGAVVAIIVVMVKAILRPLVPLQESLQLAPGRRRYLQLLNPDRAVGLAVRLDVRLGRVPLHPVPHPTLDKAEQKLLLVKIKEPVIVGLIGAADGIVDPDGIMAESLPDLAAGTHGHEIDAERGVGRGGGAAGQRGSLLSEKRGTE